MARRIFIRIRINKFIGHSLIAERYEPIDSITKPENYPPRSDTEGPSYYIWNIGSNWYVRTSHHEYPR